MSRWVARQFQAGRALSLDAVEQGRRGPAPILLLHGLSDSWRSFLPLLDALPEDLHAVAVSQRGHGRSDKPRGDYAPAAFVEDVCAVLDALGRARAVIVGHSMGAWIAAHLAAQRPDRIAGLVLINGFARFSGNPGIAELARDVEGLSDPVDPDFIRAFQEGASAPDLPAAFFDAVLEDAACLPAQAWRSLMESFLAADVPERFDGFSAPALIIYGDADPIVPREDQDLLLARLPQARLEVIAGAGHSPHWERPAEIAALLARFVAAL